MQCYSMGVCCSAILWVCVAVLFYGCVSCKRALFFPFHKSTFLPEKDPNFMGVYSTEKSIAWVYIVQDRSISCKALERDTHLGVHKVSSYLSLHSRSPPPHTHLLTRCRGILLHASSATVRFLHPWAVSLRTLVLLIKMCLRVGSLLITSTCAFHPHPPSRKFCPALPGSKCSF